jgi:hypothetical protein
LASSISSSKKNISVVKEEDEDAIEEVNISINREREREIDKSLPEFNRQSIR